MLLQETKEKLEAYVTMKNLIRDNTEKFWHIEHRKSPAHSSDRFAISLVTEVNEAMSYSDELLYVYLEENKMRVRIQASQLGVDSLSTNHRLKKYKLKDANPQYSSIFKVYESYLDDANTLIELIDKLVDISKYHQ